MPTNNRDSREAQGAGGETAPRFSPETLLPRGTIHVLPEGVANRIAAGEVVERPASVVKELIENALDAEATRITVSVREAGLEELLVSDNGWGMDDKELALAFRRHATSKIKGAEDLLHILHLGFRGEALPSVGSVARVEIVSRREDRDSGYMIRVEGGKETGPEPAPRERGTTVKVRSLFYNVPARRKFLRTPATEYGHVVQAFRRYALAYPDLSWELIRDGKVVWNLEATDLVHRIGQLFGGDATADLHSVESRSGDIFVNGVVGGTSLFRRSRGDQYLFVNKRPFQSNALHHAVVNGFGPLIQPGQVPFYVLNMRLDPEEFDVNVHPAKHEVRFRDEGLAYRSILVGIRNALGLAIRSGDAPVKAPFSRPGGEERQPTARPTDGLRELQLLFGPHREAPIDSSTGRPAAPPTPYTPEPGGALTAAEPSRPAPRPAEIPPPPTRGDRVFQRGEAMHGAEDAALEAGSEATAPAAPGTASAPTGGALTHETTTPAPQGKTAERVNVWQLHRTYILSQTKSGLVIIDQHVAHERILFEKAIAAMKERPWSGQRLLFPVTVTLDPSDAALLEEMAPGLARMGFEVEPFGGRDWVIRSVPAGIKVHGEEKLLRDILGDYRQEHEVRLQPEESLAATFACKAAIKAGDPLSLDEMNALIDELFTTKYPFVCPHGRPVVVNLTIHELHRLFGRE